MINNNDFEFVPYTSKGVTYSIPKFHGTPQCKICNDASLRVDSDAIRSGNTFYLYSDVRGKKLSYLLCLLNDVDAECEVVVALYKKGVPEPLHIRRSRALYSDGRVEVCCDSDEYTFGDYFILVSGVCADSLFVRNETMGGNLRFDFSLLKHGETMPMPSINDISLSASGRGVQLSVAFDAPQSGTDEFTFHCLSENFSSMCAPVTFRFGAERRRKLNKCFYSKKLWTCGRYTIYSMHNGEPFDVACFRYDGTDFILEEHRRIESASQEHLFAKYMLTGDNALRWNQLAELPGYTECKRRIIADIKTIVMNSLRTARGLKGIMPRRNYCVGHYDKKFMEAFVPLATCDRSFMDADCNSLLEQKYTADSYEEVDSLISSCTPGVMVLWNVGALLSSGARQVLAKLEAWLDESEHHTLFLCGSDAETSALIEMSPIFSRLFSRENVLHQEPYTLAEQLHAMQRIIAEYDFTLDGAAERRLLSMLTEAYNKGISVRWCHKELKALFEEHIYPRVRERIVSCTTYKERRAAGTVFAVTADDLNIELACDEESSFEVAMKELDAMVGLGNLKSHLGTLFTKMKFDNLRRNAGLRVPDSTSHHMIFTGNPGTGKTTVAKKIGRIYRSLGLLSGGEVIVTERAKIVGRYIGETERNVQQLLEQARGNVLFIDEAYTLCDTADDRKDFGYHVIDALLTVLAQPNPDMLVIMAGYKKEMERMMLVNQGLEGRFPYKFHFDDYSADELMSIALSVLDKEQYTLTADAADALRRGIEHSCKNRDAHFSNARWVGQLVTDGVVQAMGARVMSCGCRADRELLTLVQKADVESALERFGYRPCVEKTRRCIGFL